MTPEARLLPESPKSTPKCRAGDWRQLGFARRHAWLLRVEGLKHGLDQGVVMHECPLLAHEEVLSREHFEVEDRLNRIARHGDHAVMAAESSDGVAWPELAGHHPALAGLPETVNSRDDDRLIAELDAKRRIGRVVVDGHDRLERQGPGPGVLGQHLIADTKLLDRLGASQGANRRARAEATMVDRRVCLVDGPPDDLPLLVWGGPDVRVSLLVGPPRLP